VPRQIYVHSWEEGNAPESRDRHRRGDGCEIVLDLDNVSPATARWSKATRVLPAGRRVTNGTS